MYLGLQTPVAVALNRKMMGMQAVIPGISEVFGGRVYGLVFTVNCSKGYYAYQSFLKRSCGFLSYRRVVVSYTHKKLHTPQ